MASKLQEYRRMSEEAQRQLTGSLERWQSFLATASRLYKYPYHEQVMIHAQRPDATACAEFDVWNNTMRRYVRRGSKGIALIDTSGDRERLRYVFDVSDTGTRPNSRSLNLWELREEHIPAVSSMLEKNYGVPAGESLAVQLEAVASQLAREYWEDNRRDKLNAENDSLSSEKERLEKELLALSQSRNRELTETCDMARQTLTADELTNEMLLFFIDRVNVYSGMRVEIIYHFSDEIARLIEQENTAE